MPRSHGDSRPETRQSANPAVEHPRMLVESDQQIGADRGDCAEAFRVYDEAAGRNRDHIGDTASPPEVHGFDHQISQLIAERTDYFKAPASNFPTLPPPPLLTNDVRIGIAFLTISGLRPRLENAEAALARPAADPAICDIAPAAPPPPASAGAALSKRSIPGTAFETC